MADEPTIDPEAFHAFEHAGWERASAHYLSAFGGLTRQAIEPLIEAVHAGPGVRLLDVACGPGDLAAEAVRRGASVVGVDFSATMVATARARHPGLEFREGNAEALVYSDGAFEAVTMAFGLLHLARPERALAEAHRVLCPGGRFAFTVWRPPEECVAFRLVLHAIETHGNPNVPLPPGPPFFRFADPAEAERALLRAGFASPTASTIPMLFRLEHAEGLFTAMLQGGVRTAAILRGQSPQALDAIAKALREAVVSYKKGDGYELPMAALLASGIKP